MSYAEKIILADLGGTVADVTASNALKVDGSAVTQPISAVSLPLPTGAALEATLQNIKTAVEIIDNFISGTKGLVTEDNSAAIKTAVETIDNFISGSRGLVTEDNSAAILTALGTIITALAGTLTVSGTVTANAGTNLNTSALALETTLQSVKTAVETIDNAIAGSEMQVDIIAAIPSGDNTIGRVKLTDGTDVADIFDLANSNPLSVAIVDAAGDQVTSFGGSTQYIEGDVDATIIGTASLMEVSGNELRPLQGSVTDGLLVDLGANNDVTVTGSVTANAGTNLNTSALALETTATAIKNAVELIDNAISGSELQVDVVASLPAGTNNIGDVDIASITAGDNVIGRVKLSDGTDVADILDLANSNPLVVAIVDASGDQITSFGGGTQYTEDAAAAADPVGGALIARRRDSLAAETTTDGDNVALNSTNKGELYVKHVDTIPVTDNGGSITIDAVSLPLPTGAATDTNQASEIALLTTIDGDTGNISTKIDTIAGAVSGSEVQVDIVSLPNEGQQTMANSISVAVASDQSAIPVSDGGGSITVDGPLTDAQLRATAVDVNITGGSVSIGAEVEIKNDSGNPIPISDNGGSVTVDSTNLDIRDLTFADDKVDASGTVLGAGTNYVGKVRLTDGATDGEIVPLAGYNAQAVAVVDGSGNQITSFGGGTQYTEDVASAADPVGGVIIARRRDSLSAETTTDGDNVALNSTNKGELYVKHVDAIPITDNGGSVTVDNGGTFVTQENGAALTALQLIDDAIIADDASFTPATTKIMMAGFEYDDTATDSVDEGDAGAARMSANRNIYIQIRDAAGNERGVNVNASNELKVDASGNQLSISSVGSNKSPQKNFISQQQVAANAVVVGSTTTVVYAKEMNVGIWIGRRAATASTGPINIRIEGNNTYAGAAGYWVPISTYISNYAAVESEAVSGTANAWATTINVASTTNLAVGDIVYFDNGTAANSEWHRIKSLVTNTSITLEEALVNAQTGSTIYNGAEIQGITCDVLGYYHVRVVVDGSLFTQNFMIRCLGSYAN